MNATLITIINGIIIVAVFIWSGLEHKNNAIDVYPKILPSSNVEKSIDFYTNVLAFPIVNSLNKAAEIKINEISKLSFYNGHKSDFFQLAEHILAQRSILKIIVHAPIEVMYADLIEHFSKVDSIGRLDEIYMIRSNSITSIFKVEGSDAFAISDPDGNKIIFVESKATWSKKAIDAIF